MNTIFAICGPIGSGKSSVSKQFAARIGATWNSFGSTTREIAKERGLPSTRQALQALGADLVANEQSKFCGRVLGAALRETDKPGVIDGLRHARILSCVRKIVDPRHVAVIYVDAPVEVRLQRVKLRDGLSEAQLAELDRHSTEVEVEQKLKALADFVADNSGTTELCVSEIVRWANDNT